MWSSRTDEGVKGKTVDVGVGTQSETPKESTRDTGTKDRSNDPKRVYQGRNTLCNSYLETSRGDSGRRKVHFLRVW